MPSRPVTILAADGDALERLRTAAAEAGGRELAFAGAGFAATFDSSADALTCALRFQAGRAGTRVALAGGDVRFGTSYIGGAAISLAARLLRLAPLGGIILPASLLDGHAIDADPLDDADFSVLEPMLISAAACAAWTSGSQPPAAPAMPADPRIALALVPFRGLGAAAAFADSATDDTIRMLGGLATWIAVTRAASAPVRTLRDSRRAGQASGARYVLHGSAEAMHGAVRLTAELTEAETGRVLWSDRFDRGGLLNIASLAAQAVARRELERISLVDPAAVSGQDRALKAYAAILCPDRSTFPQSLDWVAAEATPAARFAVVAWHLTAIAQGWSRDARADAHAALAASAQLDRNDPASVALLGFLHSVVHRDHALACDMLDRVIDQAPACGTAWALKANVLCQMGEGEDAVAHAGQAEARTVLGFERAKRAETMAMAHYVAGRYVEAVRWARTSQMHHDGLAINARMLACSLVVLGRLDEAQQAGNRVLAIDPGFRIGAWRLRSLFTADQRERYAQRLRLAGLPE